MMDYFKFWLAKELVSFAIPASIALLLGMIFGVAWVVGQSAIVEAINNEYTGKPVGMDCVSVFTRGWPAA